MDVFSICAPFGTEAFFSALRDLHSRLVQPDAFLTENDIDVLGRLLTFRHVAIAPMHATKQLCTKKFAAQPLCLNSALVPDAATGVPLFAHAPLLLLVLVGGNHFSSIIVDLVDREAHRFDSHPTAEHRQLAVNVLHNLHALGLIQRTEFTESLCFNQPSTQCGVYALRLACDLEHWYAERLTDLAPRASQLVEVLDGASDSKLVRDLRAELAMRVDSARACTVNAEPTRFDSAGVAQTPAPEGGQQANALGPYAARAPLFALCTAGMVPSALALTVIADRLPANYVPGLHEMALSTTTVSELAARTLGEKSISLVLVTTDTGIVACATMLMRAADNLLHLLMPASPIYSAALPALNAVAHATGARVINVHPRAPSGVWPASLGLAAVRAAARKTPPPRPGLIGAEALELCMRSRPWESAHSTALASDDWLFRAVLAEALHSGHVSIQRILDANAADPLRAVQLALGTAATGSDSAVQLSASTRDLLSELHRKAQALCECAKLHAPMRRRRNCDSGAMHGVYTAIGASAEARTVLSLLHAMLCVARSVGAPHLVYRIVSQACDSVLQMWPACFVMFRDGEITLTPSGSSAGHEVLMAALRGECEHPVAMCPVALIDGASERVLRVVSVTELADLERRKALVTNDRVDARFTRLLPLLEPLGGSVDSSAASMHAVAHPVNSGRLPRFVIDANAPSLVRVPFALLTPSSACPP